MNKIDELLRNKPYSVSDKKEMFDAAILEAFTYHYNHNDLFKNYCEINGFTLGCSIDSYNDLPYLPVNIFKNRRLVSVKDDDIKGSLSSSATSGVPSTVYIDSITKKRQTIASANVMSDFLGQQRMPFLVLDVDPKLNQSQDISARYAATVGFLVFATSAEYMLIENSEQKLELNIDQFKESLDQLSLQDQPACIFGFTFILYHHFIRRLKELGYRYSLPKGSKLIHIGGWKKLEDQKVDKDTFFSDIEDVLGVSSDHVMDFYGFTEQMGVIYPNAGYDSKVTSLYSEIIVRDVQSLEPVSDGKEGLVQFITPVPHSYPGISVLTEDMGRITGRGQDKNGRYGVQFEIIGRAKKAEVRGCGDIMSEYVS